MANDEQQQRQQQQPQDQQAQDRQPPEKDLSDTDGLAHKKPEDLTPEELRLMADTMPGDGPGD